MRKARSFRLFEQVLQNDFRVVIPRIVGGFFSVLNRFLGTPLQASEALLASVKPRWLSVDDLDISGRTDFRADSTTIAFIVHPEFLVHLSDRPKRHPVDPGKDDVLPKRSPVHLFLLYLKYRCGNAF